MVCNFFFEIEKFRFDFFEFWMRISVYTDDFPNDSLE